MIYTVKVFGATVEWTKKFKEAEASFKEAGRGKEFWQVNTLTGSAKRLR